MNNTLCSKSINVYRGRWGRAILFMVLLACFVNVNSVFASVEELESLPEVILEGMAEGTAGTVTSPASGYQWKKGTSYTIRWSGFSDSTVKIDLYQGSYKRQTITSSTSNDGSYTWTLPSNFVYNGSDFRIRMVNGGGSGIGYSNYFSVVSASSAGSVTAPSSGYTWNKGTSYTIRWNGFSDSSVKIELFQSSTRRLTVTSSTSNDGSYSYTLPSSFAYTGSNFRIKITNGGGSGSSYSDYFTIPTSSSGGTVTSPSSGDEWIKGQSYDIRWTDFSDSSVKIELFQGSYRRDTITSSTSNDGRYSYTVPSSFAYNGSDFRIKITNGGGSGSDYSSYFTIKSPATGGTVTSPASGDQWIKGNSYTIRWNGFSESKVKVDLYQGSTRRLTIDSSTSNDGSLNYTVPLNFSYNGSDFRIRIVNESGAGYDYSGYFTIKSEDTAGTITSPSSGDQWIKGNSYNIRWTGFSDSSVNIDLYQGSIKRATIASGTNNDGSYSYSLPSNFSYNGSDFRIRMVNASGAGIAYSSNFSISSPQPVVTSPSGGSYDQGVSLPIGWSDFPSGNVKIELYQNTSFKHTVSSSTSNDGTHNWTISDSFQGSNFRVKVTSTSDTSKTAYSGYFTINEIYNPQVTSPTGGTYDYGDALSIRWSGYPGTSVKIELFQGSIFRETIHSSSSNDGSYNWSVSSNATGSNYKVKVTSNSDSSKYAYSGSFTINAPPDPVVTAPSGGTYNPNDDLAIRWSNFPTGNVKLELYQNTTFKSSISGSTSNDGSFNWSVSNAFYGSNFRVKVTSLSDSSKNAFSGYFTINQEPQPAVTSPSGGSYDPGTSLPIRWSNFPGSNVKIQLYQGGTYKETIVSSVSNNGSYNWNVSASYHGSGFKIKVTSTADTSKTADSASFTINQQFDPVVSSPSGGSFNPGDNLHVGWSGYPTGNVKIDLYQNGTYKKAISSSTANDGSFTWSVTNDVNGDNYKVRVTSLADSSKYANSGSFTINQELTPVVSQPANGEVWQRGNSYMIRWSGYSDSKVKIELFKGSARKETIASSTANDGSYAYTLPASFAFNGDDFRIKITNSSGSGFAYSGNFTISSDSPTVSSPSGGTYKHGAVLPIRWSGYPGNSVKLELLQNGSQKTQISSSTSNDGSFDWTIGNSFTGDGFRIKVSSSSDSSKTATSSNFSIESADGVASIKGRVVDVNNQPLFDAYVYLEGAESKSLYLNPGDGGYFTFDNLKLNRSYSCEVVKANYKFSPKVQSVTTSQQVNHFPQVFKGALEEGATYSLSGKVTDRNADGMPGIILFANGKSTTTDHYGSYKFENLPTGQYLVQFTHGVAGNSNTYKITKEIKDRNITDVNFVILSSNKISGRVLEADGLKGISGEKVYLRGGKNQETSTNSRGYYEFESLPNGKYTVAPAKSDKYERPSYQITLSDSNAPNTDFVLKSGNLKSLQFGGFTVKAESIIGGDGKYTAKGNVRLGDLLFADTDLDLELSTLTVKGNGRLYTTPLPLVGSITLNNGSFEFSGARFFEENEFEVYGFTWGLDHFLIRDNTLEIDAYLRLPDSLKVVDEGNFEASMKISPNKFQLENFNGSADEIRLGKAWVLKDTNFSYENTAEGFNFNAESNFTFPLLKSKFKGLGADFALVNGSLRTIHIHAHVSIPLAGGAIFLNRISGGLDGIGDKTTPLFIDAGVNLSAGPELMDVSLLSTDLDVRIGYPGYFSGKGLLYVLSYEVANAMIEYDYKSGIWAETNIDIGNIITSHGEVEINKAGISGSMNSKVGIPVSYVPTVFQWLESYDGNSGNGVFDLMEADGSFVVRDNEAFIKTTFQNSWFTVEAELSANGFRLIKPFNFVVNKSGRVLNSTTSPDKITNSEKQQILPKGLYRAIFTVAGERDLPDVTLITANGQRVKGKNGGLGVEYLSDPRFNTVVYVVYQPDPGKWQLQVNNEKSLGRLYTILTKDEKQPGLVFKSVNKTGNNTYLIKWDKTDKKGVKVDLRCASADALGKKRIIATSEELGDATEFTWDTSDLPPGSYYVYGRVFDSNSAPLTVRSKKAVRIKGSSKIVTPGKPRFKLLDDDRVRLNWKHTAGDSFHYYKLYYSDDLKSKTFKNFVAMPLGEKVAVLGTDTLNPGRKYKVAVSAVDKDGRESSLSKVKKFRYKARNTNNSPFITSKPGLKAKPGMTYSYKAKALDFDRDKVYFSLEKAPEGMSVDFNSGKVSWKVKKNQTGYHTVKLMAADDKGGKYIQKFSISVVPSNNPGSMDVREIDTSNGKGLLVVYTNSAMNKDGRKIEEMKGFIEVGPGKEKRFFELSESSRNSNQFIGYIAPEKMESAKPKGMSSLAFSQIQNRISVNICDDDGKVRKTLYRKGNK